MAGHMNLFRLVGDGCHLLSFVVMFWKLFTSKSVAGISLKTQARMLKLGRPGACVSDHWPQLRLAVELGPCQTRGPLDVAWTAEREVLAGGERARRRVGVSATTG